MIKEVNGKKTIEVLAPAGSYESLKAAVAAGADAVYAGGRRFGARAFAKNLSEDELLEALDYAHLHGCRFYLTVNTLFKNEEIRQLPAYLNPLYEYGLDAVIVQDVGALKVVREFFPDLDVHASTQMSITGEYGARFLKQAGAVRVVPARELSLSEIRRLKERTGMEVECFVHGALCYCYSGQCLMSSMIGGRSGNRGQCAQPCRLSYRSEEKDGHLLSLKDICALDLIPELVEAGIDSFKIEGRMKRPEYVAGVTAAYRKYTDLYLKQGKKGFHVDEEDKVRLLDLFNRGGFHGGYYKQRNGRDMISMERPGHAGVAAVKVRSQRGRELEGIALTQISAGDVIGFASGKDSGKAAGKGKDDSVKGNDSWNYTFGVSAKKGDRVMVLAPRHQKVQAGRVLYRIRNRQLLEELGNVYVFGKRQEKVYGILKLSAGKRATLEVACGDVRVEARTSLNVEMATDMPLEEERVRRQICKTNETEFVFERLDVVLEGGLFLPMRQLNELRRDALGTLAKRMQELHHRRPLPNREPETGGLFGVSCHAGEICKEASRHGERVSVLVETREQLKVVLKFPRVERIYLDFDLAEAVRDEVRGWRERPAGGTGSWEEQMGGRIPMLYVALPFVVREHAARRMECFYESLTDGTFDGVLARNYESVQFLRERGFLKPIVLDSSLYVMNKQAMAFWDGQEIAAFTLPFELNHRELADLGADCCELVVYGHYPVMISAQCVEKTVAGCAGKSRYIQLFDRYNNPFPVRLCCTECHNVIYNPKPLYLYDLREELDGIAPGWVRFQFTVEDGARTEEVLGWHENERMEGYTRGHFFRGVT